MENEMMMMMINSTNSSIGKKPQTLQLKIISTENIKPSTPTPLHLKHHKLCLLDQFFGFTYVPQILFYNTSLTNHDYHLNNVNNMNVLITRLKDSLSKTLSLFYPLAGRLNNTNESIVDCNDEGVIFVEAQANITLREFLQAPNRVDEVYKFLPGINTKVGMASEVIPLVIQVSTFACQGIAVGSQYLHKLMDGASWGNFLNNWAAITGEFYKKVVAPDFVTATTLFPPCSWACRRSSMVLTTRPLEGSENEENRSCVVKAFIFNPQAISNLQAKVRSELVPNPTRIEALSGFIWKYAMSAAAMASVSKSKVDVLGTSVLIHSVNMRPRMKSPIPPTTIGNLIIHATAFCENQQQASPEKPSMDDLKGLVAEIRKGFLEAKDPEFLSKFQGEKGAEAISLYKKHIEDISKDKNITTYKFTSWSKLNMLTDFGFGMPQWIAFTGGKMSGLFRNLVLLIEIPDCGGIEAWLILDEKEMDILVSNEEFCEFASPS